MKIPAGVEEILLLIPGFLVLTLFLNIDLAGNFPYF